MDVDESLLWITKRLIAELKPDGQMSLFWCSGHGVLVNGFVVTMAHALFPSTDHERIEIRHLPPGGEFVLEHRRPFAVGGDPKMTVCGFKPPRRREGVTFREVLEHKELALADNAEVLTYPRFADPYSDVALFGPHHDDAAAWDELVATRRPVAVRTTPLAEGDAVHVACSAGGWEHAKVLCAPAHGPNAILEYEMPVRLDWGDCGNPIVDDHGELVGVMALGPIRDDPKHNRGSLAQLCRVLPPWAMERICGAREPRAVRPAPIEIQLEQTAEVVQ